jgi:acetylornithine/N-succinyldiaminopimelate aminotransferase
MSESTVKNPPFPKNYAQEFIVFVSGEGVWLTDRIGKRYLDFGSGIAVNALGYGKKDLAKIASEQMSKLIHVSNLYATEPALELSQELVASGPFSAVHFGNSGAEANEAAIKYARLYSLRTKGEGKHKILSLTNGFHGRTLGALSSTFTPKYQDPFKPLLPGFDICAFNDIDQLQSTLDPSYAAVIVEIIQGEGGLDKMTKEFASALNRLSKEHDVLIVADEVQTGLARTGSLYACHRVGLEPDILTLSKPLAAGLPLSATLIPEKVDSLLHVGEHGTTFGGGPVTTAVALEVWKTLSDSAFIAEVEAKGEFLAQNLEELKSKYAFLGHVKGDGLLRGIEVDEIDISKVLAEAQEAGLLVLRSGQNVLRLVPPLIISEDELQHGIGILDQVFNKLKEA